VEAEDLEEVGEEEEWEDLTPPDQEAIVYVPIAGIEHHIILEFLVQAKNVLNAGPP
jgi:hypothetical protein